MRFRYISMADRMRVVAFAHAQAGKPYVLGAAGPSSFDCSGLVMRAWQQVGLELPHHAAYQYTATHRIYGNGLRPLPGDLVFYYGDLGHLGEDAPHHVAMVGIGFTWHFGRLTHRIVQATDPAHGCEAGISARKYATPFAWGRPDYMNWMER